MSSNGVSVVTRKVTANNGTLNVRVGFKPKKVVIRNATSIAMLEWDDTLPDGYAWKTVSAGTRTLITTKGVTPIDWSNNDPPGFSIGAETDINDTTSEILHIEAWRE